MKYYVVAGEASGDLHASNLMKALKRRDPQADFRCWGGDLMEAQGGDIVKHYKDLAFMGFFEVVKHLRTILNNIQICKIDILLYKPDVLVLVDFPGFNLRLVRFAKEHNIRIVYYISPTVWAWKTKRVYKIRQYVDEMLCILPFEAGFYVKFDYRAHYTGHPLLDAIDANLSQSDDILNFREHYNLDERPIIALLPGSRAQEVKAILPRMIAMTEHFPQYQFVLSKVNWLPETLYSGILKNRKIAFAEGSAYPLLSNARAALVASGTATLETAIFRVPQVVCYAGNWLSYYAVKFRLNDIKYISLPNLILNRPLLAELIQADLNNSRLQQELDAVLHDEKRITAMQKGYEALYCQLGGRGASERAAAVVWETALKAAINPEWTLFLDRDGVINRQIAGGYVTSAGDFVLIEETVAALTVARRYFGRIIVVTNQQCIGKGLCSAEAVEQVHQFMIDELSKKGIKIDAVYYCPHAAEEGCDCRKPNTGMALQAQHDFPEIDFAKSVMVGDSPSDLEFGKRCGMKTLKYPFIPA
ncbi:MAG: lipid-A-disaccharide synthase [Bacteroidales bacterium]|jgi:lipid-A-disaccharide synthase|nr:lipid-A-disaccharide synthase [Bacteroidales bacterium]